MPYVYSGDGFSGGPLPGDTRIPNAQVRRDLKQQFIMFSIVYRHVQLRADDWTHVYWHIRRIEK
jgi:hypothetical protein